MERWDIKSLPKNREGRSNRHSRDNPSFSSTLLDSIYRSIDEPTAGRDEVVSMREEQRHLIFYKGTMKKKQSTTAATTTSGRLGHGHYKEDQEREIMSLRRACLVEKWMEKKAAENSVPARRNSMADFETTKSRYSHQNEFLTNSSSSSSDSSGGFSSSESDSMYGSKSRSSSSCYSMHRPKPIRTSLSSEKVPFDDHQRNYHHNSQKKHENGFGKTKSKALKIYGDLKKVKQPISPGGRLASFLNSLFNAGHVKKSKIDDLGAERKSLPNLGQMGYSNPSSTCSSASSFSRSCLRKAPLSRSELSGISSSNGDAAKRSVRFCPVSVIVDEDCRPCGQKTLLEAQSGLIASAKAAAAIKPPANEDVGLECCVMDVDETDHGRRIEEVARDYLIKNYQKKHDEDDEDEDDDDDDAESYASSDLFELDTAGVEERYREELPVYETTFFDRNRAIANALIL
nr:LOW QUALITY PROTEIN: protein BIG GRAIN 1-like B [Malus domestica]